MGNPFKTVFFIISFDFVVLIWRFRQLYIWILSFIFYVKPIKNNCLIKIFSFKQKLGHFLDDFNIFLYLKEMISNIVFFRYSWLVQFSFIVHHRRIVFWRPSPSRPAGRIPPAHYRIVPWYLLSFDLNNPIKHYRRNR